MYRKKLSLSCLFSNTNPKAIKIIENSGHSASETSIRTNLLKAINKIYYKIKKK